MIGGSVEEPLVYKLYVQRGMKILLGAVFLALAGLGGCLAFFPAIFKDPKPPPPLIGLIFLAVLAVNVLWILAIPYRITWSRDGVIEFISLYRRRTVRPGEIRSIKPASANFGFFIVQTDHGKIKILAQFDGFHDFLGRLKAVSPGVELRGC